MRCFFYFSYHYKLPFDVYAQTFDRRTNKVYLLTYLLTPSVGSDRVSVRSAKVCVLEKSVFRLTDYLMLMRLGKLKSK